MVTKDQARNIYTRELVTLPAELRERLSGWKLTFNRRKRASGLCDYGKREVQLSVYALEVATPEQVLNTIRHEFAHALTPGDKHGARWRSMFIQLGGDGQRCGDYAIKAKAKYALIDTRTNEVIVEYHAKPRRPAENLQLKGDPGSSGMLEYRRL